MQHRIFELQLRLLELGALALLVGAEREVPLQLGEAHFQFGVFAAKSFEGDRVGLQHRCHHLRTRSVYCERCCLTSSASLGRMYAGVAVERSSDSPRARRAAARRATSAARRPRSASTGVGGGGGPGYWAAPGRTRTAPSPGRPGSRSGGSPSSLPTSSGAPPATSAKTSNSPA